MQAEVAQVEQWAAELEVLCERIYPHYGVFAPTRQDYLDLVANAELPFGPHSTLK